MRPLHIVLAILFFCFFTSCQKDKDNCRNTSPWYQKDVHLTFLSTQPGLTDYIEFYVTRINKSRVRSIDNVGVFAPAGYLQLCGKKVFKANTQEYKNTQLFYDLDGNIGDKWVVNTEVYGRKITETITLKAKNISVTAPYGTFNTSVFEIIGETDYPYNYDLYVTDDHGPVKLTGWCGMEVNLELLSRNF